MNWQTAINSAGYIVLASGSSFRSAAFQDEQSWLWQTCPCPPTRRWQNMSDLNERIHRAAGLWKDAEHVAECTSLVPFVCAAWHEHYEDNFCWDCDHSRECHGSTAPDYEHSIDASMAVIRGRWPGVDIWLANEEAELQIGNHRDRWFHSNRGQYDAERLARALLAALEAV